MKDKLNLYYDKEGDFIEFRIGRPVESYFDELEDDVFERRDKKTGKVIGFAIFNFKKRTEKMKEININLPVKLQLVS